jgi:hypothetical protein
MVRCTSKRVKYAITIDLQLILVGALKLQTGKVPPYYMEDIKPATDFGLWTKPTKELPMPACG